MVIDTNVYDKDGNIITNLAQYDRDVYIYFKEGSIVKSQEVHFLNTKSEYALVVSGTLSNGALKARVPGNLLAQSYPIIVFVYADFDGGKQSIFRARINVIARPQPNDYVYDGTDDYITVEELLNTMQGYVSEINDIIQGYRIKNIQASDDGNGNVSVYFG